MRSDDECEFHSPPHLFCAACSLGGRLKAEQPRQRAKLPGAGAAACRGTEPQPESEALPGNRAPAVPVYRRFCRGQPQRAAQRALRRQLGKRRSISRLFQIPPVSSARLLEPLYYTGNLPRVQPPAVCTVRGRGVPSLRRRAVFHSPAPAPGQPNAPEAAAARGVRLFFRPAANRPRFRR